MSASSAAPTAPARAPRSSRARGIAASSAVVVFLGTAAMAPYSVADAFADPGRPVSFERTAAQGLDSVEAAETYVDTEITAVEVSEEPSRAKAPDDELKSGDALYSLQEFMFSGVVNWEGYKFTFYSQQVLPGPGLQIPGRHVNDGGYVSDADGYIVLAGDAPLGTVFETPFGHPGKIYDRGTVGNHLDVYIR